MAGGWCPHCQSRRRHKGRESRQAVTSVGAISLEGVYWMCPGCGVNEHAADRLLGDELLTAPMRELTCLMGVTQRSFAEASAVCENMLGVRLSDTTIAAKTEEEGRVRFMVYLLTVRYTTLISHIRSFEKNNRLLHTCIAPVRLRRVRLYSSSKQNPSAANREIQYDADWQFT